MEIIIFSQKKKILPTFNRNKFIFLIFYFYLSSKLITQNIKEKYETSNLIILSLLKIIINFF